MKTKSTSLSIRKRLFIAIFIILVIQVLFLAVGILRGGLVKKLKHEYINIFDQKVFSRTNYIQDTIKRYYTSLFEYENFIQKKISENHGVIDHKLLEEISERAVLGLRQSGATGIFVIFDSNEGKEGFYIRDLEPTVIATDNSDLLFLNGPISVARKIRLSLDREWSSDFKLDRGSPVADFYYKPIDAASIYHNVNFKDLGYWNLPVRMSPRDVEVITYSVPLISGDKKPYGVIGLDLTIDHLKSLLPYDELVENKQGAYMIGVYNKGEKPEKVLSSGPIFNKILDFENEVSFMKDSEGNDGYKINNNYISVYKINLYNDNNPFATGKWYLAGVVEENKLFGNINQLIGHVFLYLSLWLLLGILCIFVVGNWFISPITNLIKQLLEKNPNEKILLDETNIVELNELSRAIEIMSDKIVDSFSKLSQVVDMINIPIGAFEHIHGEDHVFITDGMYGILEMPKDEAKSNYISVEKLKNILSEIKKCPEKDAKNVYLNEKKQGEFSWLRIQIREEGNRTLGIIEDVTEEIIKRRQLEYERDLDPLTKLLNRRGFTAKVKEKIESESIGIAALIMWDLDNLKYVNDTYGHDYGDQYIKLAAEVLKELTIFNSFVARMSGDEFFVFIYGHEDKKSVREIINNIQDKINSAHLIIREKKEIRLRASAGVAWYPDDSVVFDELVKYSDFAMYQVKNSNKGNIAEFDKGIYMKDPILLNGK